MGILDVVKQRTPVLRKALKYPVVPQYPNWQYLIGADKSLDYKYEDIVGSGIDNSLLVAILVWMMRTLPEVDITLNQFEESTQSWTKRIIDHAFLDLLETPNPWHTGKQLMQGIVLSRTADGNAFVAKRRAEDKVPVQLQYLPHWMVRPEGNENELITHYIYNPPGTSGDEIKIPKEDMIHFRFGIDPNNPRLGYSWVKALLKEFYTDDEAARFSATMLMNMGVPGLVVSPLDPEVTISREEAEVVKGEFERATTGSERGRPLVMRGPTKLDTYGFTPAELELSRLRAIPESRVAALSGIPAAVIGFLAGMEMTKVGATMKELREQAMEAAIIPAQNEIAADLWRWLLPEFTSRPRKYRVGFDLAHARVLQEDETKKTERIVMQVANGLITRAQGKRELGYQYDESDEVYVLRKGTTIVPGTIDPNLLVTVGSDNGVDMGEPESNGKVHISDILKIGDN